MKKVLLLAAAAVIALTVGGIYQAAEENQAQREGQAPREDAAKESTMMGRVTPQAVEGGNGGFWYTERVPVTSGDYPVPGPSLSERGMAAAAAEAGKPLFEGVVNGIRLWSSEDSRKVICGGGDYIGWELSERLVFGYLPPDTAAQTPQQSAICPDGSAAWTGQHFVVGGFAFLSIYFEAGERAFNNDAPAERVAPATVQGRPGVMVRPLTPEGFGRTWVVFTTDKGAIIVEAVDLPLADVLKVANGVRCDDC